MGVDNNGDDADQPHSHGRRGRGTKGRCHGHGARHLRWARHGTDHVLCDDGLRACARTCANDGALHYHRLWLACHFCGLHRIQPCNSHLAHAAATRNFGRRGPAPTRLQIIGRWHQRGIFDPHDALIYHDPNTYIWEPVCVAIINATTV